MRPFVLLWQCRAYTVDLLSSIAERTGVTARALAGDAASRLMDLRRVLVVARFPTDVDEVPAFREMSAACTAFGIPLVALGRADTDRWAGVAGAFGATAVSCRPLDAAHWARIFDECTGKARLRGELIAQTGQLAA